MTRFALAAAFAVSVAACAGDGATDASVGDGSVDSSPRDGGADSTARDSSVSVDTGPSCGDGIRNGDESDTDCGGACDGCRAGEACAVPADCVSAQCTGGACVDLSCEDGILNGDESDVDCGGDCALCVAGDLCASGRDCVSRFCGDDGRCLAPACDDGVRNGLETGVDCGGDCGGCPECIGCLEDADCALGRCALGRCATREEVYVDWRRDCRTDGTLPITVDLPLGRYRVTALESGGSVWSTTSLPTTGWHYRIECMGLSVPSLATPRGVYYANAASAFAALMSTTEDVDFSGGTLACGRGDSTCSDNRGGVRFQLERLCIE